MWLTRAYENSIQMHFPTLMYGHVFSRIIQSARCQRFISTDALAKHKADYRRNRKSRHFVDTLLVQVHAGHGGDGCVSFHREKFVQIGPAAGGNGGTGGNVYLRCDPTIHSLARVSKRVAATNGTHGEGDWLHGRSGTDVTIHVPVGTTVRSLGQILNEKSAAAQPYLTIFSRLKLENPSQLIWMKRQRSLLRARPCGDTSHVSKKTIMKGSIFVLQKRNCYVSYERGPSTNPMSRQWHHNPA